MTTEEIQALSDSSFQLGVLCGLCFGITIVCVIWLIHSRLAVVCDHAHKITNFNAMRDFKKLLVGEITLEEYGALESGTTTSVCLRCGKKNV